MLAFCICPGGSLPRSNASARQSSAFQVANIPRPLRNSCGGLGRSWIKYSRNRFAVSDSPAIHTNPSPGGHVIFLAASINQAGSQASDEGRWTQVVSTEALVLKSCSSSGPVTVTTIYAGTRSRNSSSRRPMDPIRRRCTPDRVAATRACSGCPYARCKGFGH
jgi:hypothetical protein